MLIVSNFSHALIAMCSLSCSVLYLSNDPVYFGELGYAHAVHGSAPVGVRKDSVIACQSFSYFSVLSLNVSRNPECALHSSCFIIIRWFAEEL